VILNGAGGRMGAEVLKLLNAGYCGATLAAAVDPVADGFLPSLDAYSGEADVLIDFSHRSATRAVTEYAVSRRLPAVIATTGQSEEELKMITEAAKQVPIFRSANMSIGIAALLRMAKTVAALYPDADIEIIEKHHNRKLDAPSGTALMLAEGIREVRRDASYLFGRGGQKKREKNEIGIHAVRMGNIIGEHEVIVGTDTETITLRHEAHSRSLFAEGAVAAAEFLLGRGAGIVSMADMVGQ
jgi:4-hydroxy-tetrahydrodipicolinate reductase